MANMCHKHAGPMRCLLRPGGGGGLGPGLGGGGHPGWGSFDVFQGGLERTWVTVKRTVGLAELESQMEVELEPSELKFGVDMGGKRIDSPQYMKDANAGRYEDNFISRLRILKQRIQRGLPRGNL